MIPADPSTPTPIQYVTAQIVRRYSNPARVAYTYLFRVAGEHDFAPLIPLTETILEAWWDQGGGLTACPIQPAVEACAANAQIVRGPAPPLTPHERKQMMARIVLFSVGQTREDLIVVHLLSRSLVFKGKGDRDVTEEWKRLEDGAWYSAYRPRE